MTRNSQRTPPKKPGEMRALYVSETWINATERYGAGESDVYETFTDDPGELFRAMRREYGRCISRVYIDGRDGTTPVGWVFLKRKRYEDSPDTFLLETWVTVHDAPDTLTREHHYHAIA